MTFYDAASMDAYKVKLFGMQSLKHGVFHVHSYKVTRFEDGESL